MPAVRRALDAGTLDMGEVQTILHTLLSVGGESTTSLLGNAVRMLAEDPALQQRLRARPEDIDVFVEEAWPSGTASISASEPVRSHVHGNRKHECCDDPFRHSDTIGQRSRSIRGVGRVAAVANR
jgi:hypothetical protein